MQVNRKKLVGKLEVASAGLTPNDILEQSSSFVFKGGKLITFDGEVYTEQKMPLDFEGAVPASEFSRLIQRFPDETIEIGVEEGEVKLEGKRREAGIVLHTKIVLPFEQAPKPKQGTVGVLSPNLLHSLKQAASVCGQDETSPKTTHVHITPDRVETTDSYRMYRKQMQTGFPVEALIHASIISRLCKTNIQKVSLSDGWAHFKFKGGRISVVCALLDFYPQDLIDSLLDVPGERVVLPANLSEILKRAEVMDTPSKSIGGWDSRVKLSFKKGKVRIKAQKEAGWYSEVDDVQYDGPPFSFSIHPSFLLELSAMNPTVIVGNRALKVEQDKVEYVACLEKEE
jgi:DNA polymerase III sliding clamp (beta) subunit (PCNA family)